MYYRPVKFVSTTVDLLSIAKRTTVLARTYAVYPKNFVKATCSLKDQEEIFKSGKAKELKHIPIKPARSEETSSVFYDIVVNKFLNYMMKGGNKATCRNVLEDTFMNMKIIQLEKFNKASTEEEKSKIILDPLLIFKRAIANCRPLLKLMPFKRGGSIYQVPVPISDTEATFRAMRWLVLACRDKDGKEVKYRDKLAWELIDASENRGRVVKQKLDLHKQCDANRAYAHYRWL